MRVTNVAGIVIVVFIMLLVALVGAIYVYKDAKKRNMGAVKWAVIAFFYPLLTGVAAYMICRKPLIDLACPKCGATLTGAENECPGCKTLLLTRCPQCSFPVERGWKACPKCGNQFDTEFVRPIHMYRKDRGHIVTMVLVALLIVAGIVFVRMISSGSTTSVGTSAIGMGNITAEDLSKNETIARWIKDSDESKENIHVLTKEDGDTCIVYVKNSSYLMETDAYIEAYNDGHSEATIMFNESSGKDAFGYDFFLYEFDVEGEIEVDVRFNHESVEAKVTTTAEDISQSTWRESNVGE